MRLRRLTPPGTLRARPILPAAILLRGFLTFMFFAVDAFVPLALVEWRGLSLTEVGDRPDRGDDRVDRGVVDPGARVEPVVERPVRPRPALPLPSSGWPASCSSCARTCPG